MKPRIYLLLFFTALFATVSANNLRQISSREGISNNAVLSLCQDKDGYIWVGTCDGLNLWNGRTMQLFPNDWRKSTTLSGNLIEEIVSTSDSLFWIRSNYGLDLFNPEDKSVEKHSEFQGLFKFTTRHSDKVIVFTPDNKWFYYDWVSKAFAPINMPEEFLYADYLDMQLDDKDNLWFFSRKGIFSIPISFSTDGADAQTKIVNHVEHEAGVEYAFADGDKIYFIDANSVLYEFDLPTRQIIYKRYMGEELARMGVVSDIIADGDDYMISFYTNGVIRLRMVPASSEKYIVESLNISCGVFSLLKDTRQDIVWIGTDGQGVFQCTKDPISFHSITYNNLPYELSKPIRALFVDKEGALWIGTKGEGILRVDDFYNCKNFDKNNTELITAQNSALLDNSVYTFAASNRNIIWIGSDGHGLNYYSYRDRRIHVMPASGDLKYIHSVYQSDPSTLWVATVGCGVYRLTLGGTEDTPTVSDIEQIYFNDEMTIKNLFFTLYPENESVIWFGNRGGGAVRYDTKIRRSEVLTFDRGHNATANDIFAICRSRNGDMWFGTGGGLMYSGGDTTAVAGIDGAIHGILEDGKNNLWISTNRGLIKYIPKSKGVVNYGYSYGLNTVEYSDGAYFADKQRSTLFFGGINGFVVVEQTPFEEVANYPPVLFRDISINDEILNVHSLLNDNGVLVLDHGQRIFDITISALDYIDGSNYTYYSRLDGFNDQWISGSDRLSFADLPAGKYKLNVRYYNNIMGEYSPVYSLSIRIKPVWYASTLAKCLYLLLVILIIGATIRHYVMRYRRHRAERMERLENRRKEELYDSKMRFFSNITQELSMPLTMISAPCQQILASSTSELYIRRYAQTIQQNVSKLQDLIYMLHEFRGVRNVDRNENIELVSVSEIGRRIADTFVAYSEQNNIVCNFDIEHDLIWPTDKEGLSTIINTLLTNAFKHTPYNGEVDLSIKLDKERLMISVSNNSAGVNMEDIEAIFDRYRVLDYFEKKSEKGLSFQGDLGLAICHSIAERMQGDMSVESTPNAMTTFTVCLPHLKITKEGSADNNIVSIDKAYGLPIPIVKRREYPFDSSRRTMVIVNNNAEIMTFVADLFAADYNIKMLDSTEGVIDLLKQMHPDIIICDALSHQSNSLSLIEFVKQSKLTAHIPIILLSTAQQIDERIKGVELGADICLTLPFNVEYLKAVAEQLLKRNNSLKDYYKSSISAFELSDGRMLHKDDKEFLDKMLRIINDNLSNSDISTKFIADELGVSVRNLYRRLEGILNQTPTSLIKEYRLATAEQMLITTKLSIDEIIYKAGFVNRGTFFKCFALKYGCTPKIYRKQKLGAMQDEVDAE